MINSSNKMKIFVFIGNDLKTKINSHQKENNKKTNVISAEKTFQNKRKKQTDFIFLPLKYQ